MQHPPTTTTTPQGTTTTTTPQGTTTTTTPQSTTATPTAPAAPPTTPPSGDPFFARYGTRRLPRGLREEAAGMDWQLFRTIYSPEARLAVHRVEQERTGNCRFRFTIHATRRSKTEAPCPLRREITATGPAAACSQLLSESGRYVEILEFHQFPLFEATVTVVLGGHNRRQAWAMGFGTDPQTSVVHAMVCAAERLYG